MTSPKLGELYLYTGLMGDMEVSYVWLITDIRKQTVYYYEVALENDFQESPFYGNCSLSWFAARINCKIHSWPIRKIG